MKKISRLDSHVINQIAAGEIIERPSSIIKELIENSIDANAKTITLTIRNGGKSFIEIKDDGHGISKDELPIAMERHATSKLSDDLFKINTFGFRGEALPSIAAVSRFSIASKTKDADCAWELAFEGNNQISEMPKSFANQSGTIIQVSDLFFQTPVRLKFLQSDQKEQTHSLDIFKKLALNHYNVAFKCVVDEKTKYDFDAVCDYRERLKAVLGNDSFSNSHLVDYQSETLKIKGLIGVPTYNKAQSTEQYFFVNNRSIKDRALSFALKIAYGDLVPKDRFPVACLFLDLLPHDVDVNAHPAKTEVRFRDLGSVKDHLIVAIRNGLRECNQKSAAVFSFPNVSYEKKEYINPPITPNSSKPYFFVRDNSSANTAQNLRAQNIFETAYELSFDSKSTASHGQLNLGIAKLQLYKTYVISETQNNVYIIDQHAAHERITYEKYKKEWPKKQQQLLLTPEIIEIEGVGQYIDQLKQLNIIAEKLTENQILIRSMPVLLKKYDKQMFIDFFELIETHKNNIDILSDEILATLACHNSIRAGQVLSLSEMQALLDEMAITPNIAQCNHGRPTYMPLEENNLNRLFERS